MVRTFARLTAAPIVLLASGVAAVFPGTASAAATAESAAAGPTSLRVVSEPGKRISLEVSIREFTPANGAAGDPDAPVISLVGVTHIADAAYYDQLDELLADYDVVLYESVAPPGAAGAGGDTPPLRVASTTDAARFIGRTAAAHAAATGDWPESAAALLTWAESTDPRLADFIGRASTDGWGRPFDLLPAADVDAEAGSALVVRSFGRDGAPDGHGIDRDILVTVPAAAMEAARAAREDVEASGGGLQADLARALGLSYQLTAMDYGRPNFVPSDMAIDEVNAAMVARGGSMEFLEGALDGSSLPARVINVMLGVVKFADRLSGGAASTAMKVMLVEMLGDESLIEMSMGQMEASFGEVIVGERNRRVMDDLERVLAERAAAGLLGGRIAIFYGAAHMPDFEERLPARLGYEPTGEPQWLPAITIDFRTSPVSERELNQIRGMMRRQLQMMQRMQGRQQER